MWLKSAQPNIALIANKDATIAKQAAFIEEQKGTITALNIALGGEDSTSTENLVDAYEHDPESVGLCFKYRAAKDKILMQTERIKELTDDLEESDAIRDRCAHLLAETAVALKGPEKALHRHGWQDLPEVAAKQSAALKLAKDAFSAINIEAKTFMSYENARNNFSDDTDEWKAYERAMVRRQNLPSKPSLQSTR